MLFRILIALLLVTGLVIWVMARLCRVLSARVERISAVLVADAQGGNGAGGYRL